MIPKKICVEELCDHIDEIAKEKNMGVTGAEPGYLPDLEWALMMYNYFDPEDTLQIWKEKASYEEKISC